MSFEDIRSWFEAYDAGREDEDVGVERFRELLLEHDRLRLALSNLARGMQFESARRYAQRTLDEEPVVDVAEMTAQEWNGYYRSVLNDLSLIERPADLMRQIARDALTGKLLPTATGRSERVISRTDTPSAQT